MTDTHTTVQKPPEKLSLSATQVAASGLAAVSATVSSSYFGVAGTVLGAGLGSVVTVVGSSVYSYSIRRTRSRVRQSLDVAVSQRFAVQRPVRRRFTLSGHRIPLTPRRVAALAAGLFAAVLLVTTGFELASGRPLAATVSGKHGSGVSLGGGHTRSAVTPGNTVSSVPSVTHPATSGPSATGVTNPSSNPTPSSSAPPSGSTSAGPTGSSAGSTSPSASPPSASQPSATGSSTPTPTPTG